MWYNQSSEDILLKLNTNLNTGLSSSEADKRLSVYGSNKLIQEKKKNLIQLFISQLKDTMIYILFIASAISAFVGETTDSLIILVVIFINAIIGVIQESKAEKALEALKNLSSPKAVVKRDSTLIEIPSEEVVPGDIVIIDAGRYVPADLRLVESINLKIEESSFTGESIPTEKISSPILVKDNLPIAEQTNMAFMSTLSTYGRGIGVCIGTGMSTEIGKIASMLNSEYDDTTPLQKKLALIGKNLGFIAIGICTLMFIISVLQGRNLIDMFMTSISLAVAAIPEGLPAIVAIVLALGVQRMSKENAIIKKLPAVETLGSVNIICSDKTGTLTLNQMTVKQVYVNNISYPIENLDMSIKENNLLVEGMILCNDATLSATSKTGDPTEIALLDAGLKYNLSKYNLDLQHTRVNEIPFDSDRKLMSTINKYNDNFIVYTKGALDSIFTVSTKILLNGEIQDFTTELKDKVMKASNLMSDSALRVLALAYKSVTKNITNIDSIEDNLIFVGLMGMIDPPREEVKESIKKCSIAGIKTIMITGDHKNTAFAIGKELGIANSISETLSGSEIDTFSLEEFSKIITNYKIFARVSPEHKVKIVTALKSNGNIVSMTGDGVNDAPSLKAADIGVAMGITGTDVAKGAADMVLTDDNFTTIVRAVEEGRNIFTNIKKSILFLLSCNLGEVIALFFAILFNWNTPLLPIHILWINLITDSFPALSLGVDPGDSDIMKNKPRNIDESIFTGLSGKLLLFNGVLIGILTLAAFKLGEHLYPTSLSHAQTLAFAVLAISQLFYSLTIRSEKKSLFKLGIFTNKYLIISLCIGIILQVSVISIPILATLFKVFTLGAFDWILIILISIIPFAINELLKVFLK